MTQSHYSVTFDRPDGIWLWCLHCERCYKAGEYREIDGLQYCPYPECDGTTVLDGWVWDDVQGRIFILSIQKSLNGTRYIRSIQK